MGSPSTGSSSSHPSTWDSTRRRNSDSGIASKTSDSGEPPSQSVKGQEANTYFQPPPPSALQSNDPLIYQSYRPHPAAATQTMPHPDDQRRGQLSVHLPPSHHPHMQGFIPSDSSHFIPQHAVPPSGLPEQMRYGEQGYGPMRAVYPAQMYYDPSLAADYSVDPAHPAPLAPVYPTISSRTSPVNAYSAQGAIPPPFHPTTPPVPQAAWTGSSAYYGSFGGMGGPQHGGPPPMAEDMGHRQSIPSVYLSHPPTSAWSSPVMSTPFQFFSPFPANSGQVERVESIGSPTGESWAPSSTGTRPSVRPPYVPGPPPPHSVGGATWNSSLPPNPASGTDSKRPSLSLPGEDPTRSPPSRPPAHDRERKEYHPQPPARRSEWVMWVGNVPSNVSHEELWRFFNTTVPTSAQTATEPWRGPSSIFLISRSSCAFVNFSSQTDLDRAVPFFNGLSLRPWDARCPRMVCRVRRKDDDLRAGVGAQRGVGMHRTWVDQHKPPERKNTGVSPKSSLLELPDSDQTHPGHRSTQDSSSGNKSSASFASTTSSFLAHHFPKRYFILKSLSMSDLEDSVREGTWRTQRHNQPILDQAFRTSQEVILIFGANRSGEFFGYAKMVAASTRRKGPDRQLTGARGSYVASNNKQGSTNLLAPEPITRLRRNHPGSTPAPIREEDDGGDREQPRSATDPYRRISAYLTPGYHRATSPGQLDEDDDILRIANLEISEEDGALMRSESPDLMDEITRRASNATLDPNLLRGDRRESRQYRMAHLEHSSSLQIHVGGERRDTAEPRRPSEVIAENEAESVADSDPLAPAFKIEWIKTGPLSFSKTRHLRNPWNGDREVKVSRDGTEVEPNVGALLLAEWEKLDKDSGDDKSEDSNPSTAGQQATL